MKVAIVGCGYAGRVLARRLLKRGRDVLATTTTEAKLSQLAALGAEPALMKATDGKAAFARGLEDAKSVVYLAPPTDNEDPDAVAASLAEACPDDLETFVYGSTTGVFGHQRDPTAWVDELTPPRSPHERGQRRLAMELALARVGLPLRVVRIAGIYGPGRTLRDAIQRESLLLFEGAPKTSRIHVEDLVSILEAMTAATSPRMVIACDDRPSETLEVARYTCELLGVEAPAPVALEDAKRVMSPRALEMRLGGHLCRSLVRDDLIGALAYPTFIEGVKASLEAEGALR